MLALPRMSTQFRMRETAVALGASMPLRDRRHRDAPLWTCYPGAVAQQGKAAGVDEMADDTTRGSRSLRRSLLLLFTREGGGGAASGHRRGVTGDRVVAEVICNRPREQSSKQPSVSAGPQRAPSASRRATGSFAPRAAPGLSRTASRAPGTTFETAPDTTDEGHAFWCARPGRAQIHRPRCRINAQVGTRNVRRSRDLGPLEFRPAVAALLGVAAAARRPLAVADSSGAVHGARARA